MYTPIMASRSSITIAEYGLSMSSYHVPFLRSAPFRYRHRPKGTSWDSSQRRRSLWDLGGSIHFNRLRYDNIVDIIPDKNPNQVIEEVSWRPTKRKTTLGGVPKRSYAPTVTFSKRRRLEPHN
jgi:hypothetical protein